MFDKIEDGGRHFLSFGAGVQSTALLMLTLNRDERLLDAMEGWLPEAALFADPGAESEFTYQHVWEMAKLCNEHHLPLYICSGGNIVKDIMATEGRWASIPMFTANANGESGMLKRQCTSEYKIKPLHQKVRRLLGYRPRQRIKHKVYTWIGISLDEIQRAKPARDKWETKVFPLLRMGWRRSDCMNYLSSIGLETVGKSACSCCPFHSNNEWLRMKQEDQGSWSEAVRLDNFVRDLHETGRAGILSPLYLHRSLVPLDVVNLNEDQATLFSLWDEECDGMCGV